MSRATVIGSGPNGLSAAVTLARAGYEVRVLEAANTVGGGARTLPGPLPGFSYDVCSAVHPNAFSSPFFRDFKIKEKVDWITPEISYAHPLDNGRAGIAWRDIQRTATELGEDADAWLRLLRPLSMNIDGVADFTGHHLLRVPRHPITAARFALRMLEQGTPLARHVFRTEEARALIAGVFAHANAPMPSLASAAAGLLLTTQAHAGGWPYPRGGAGRIIDALRTDLETHGGTVETGVHVTNLADLDWGDPARGDLLFLNSSPRLALTHPDIPARYAKALKRYRYGAGAAKVDFALSGPVPWTNELVKRSPTVHVGGTRDEVWASENAVAQGRVSENPYVLVTQPSVFDDSRAPEGKSALWSYIHVPHGSDLDPTELVTRQIERFAPGFRDLILGLEAAPASSREALNPSEIGGDFLGGAFTIPQAIARPTLGLTPWQTPMSGVYLASASTPPGPGVNCQAGYLAAKLAIAQARRS